MRENVQHKTTITSQGFTVTMEHENCQITKVYSDGIVNLVFDKKMIGPLCAMIKEARNQWDEADETLNLHIPREVGNSE